MDILTKTTKTQRSSATIRGPQHYVQKETTMDMDVCDRQNSEFVM